MSYITHTRTLHFLMTVARFQERASQELQVEVVSSVMTQPWKSHSITSAMVGSPRPTNLPRVVTQTSPHNWKCQPHIRRKVCKKGNWMAISENTICHRFQIDKYWDTCTLFLLFVILEQNSVFVKRRNLIGMTYRIKELSVYGTPSIIIIIVTFVII